MTREHTLEPFRAPLELQIDYAAELNEQQLAAVTAPPGPSLVIAGAGSGKTRTLTYRVAYLLEQGIPPERILLLTFTNKAAREMMGRVADLLGQELAELWGGTFHSIGNRILRQLAQVLGFQRDFTILDREDAKHLIATCVTEAGIDSKEEHFPKPEVLGDIFSLSVNTHKPVQHVLEEQHRKFIPFDAEITDIQSRYAARKLAANVMDFDDLLALWLRLLQEHQDARDLYQRRFQFILVDEYQDTNKLQSDLIDLLAARHHNVMVVGDDAQSIYAWRGANFQNILKFPERYPEAKIYKIETNYRSTPEILRVANAVISANVHQFTKTLTTSRKAGMRPALVTCDNASAQAAFVASRVVELREEGTSLDKMAVLYRSHFHALELQLELTRRHIPFSITSGIRFFEQAHIKDATAYLKLVANPRDELAFKRLVRLLPGIGPKAADKLWNSYEQSRDRLPRRSEAEAGEGAHSSAPEPQGDENPKSEIRNPKSEIALRLQACASAVPKKTAAAWAQFVATIAQLDDPEIRAKPAEMIELVLEAGYEDYLEENFENFGSRTDELEQLAVFARQFPTLEDFLTQLALLTNLESEDNQPVDKGEERIRLSTIHQAKGLEFDVVFLIMLCDGLFPSKRTVDIPGGEEEERRLMYVAITRARNELYLSYPLQRAGFGDTGSLYQLPSRFLNSIPGAIIEKHHIRTAYHEPAFSSSSHRSRRH
ncbi:MAG: DNA helicase UvrD [Verrucomicrobia bacterium]|nr:MAG: DNA helicase UvrD [Verrucomicrobiota bacterium]